MRIRKLRIAFSAVCAVACVLLCALWVRSYWWWDTTSVAAKHSMASIQGKLLWDTPLAAIPRPGSPDFNTKPQFGIYSLPLDAIIIIPIDASVAMPGLRAGAIPIWKLALPIAALAAAPWIRWRFSLRTLLIATTLVAGVLGLAVYAARK